MSRKAAALVVLCLAVGTTALAGTANAGHKGGKGKAAHKKVAICHLTGNGSYRLIRIGKPAVKAHLKHGDAYPGATVPGGTLTNKCVVQPPPPQRFSSGPLTFGPLGWGGWSCPAGMKAVGGGTTLTTVAAQGIAEPGATIGGSTYPVFPHHTFAPGETGFVVQNDNDQETGTVFVDCVPV